MRSTVTPDAAVVSLNVASVSVSGPSHAGRFVPKSRRSMGCPAPVPIATVTSAGARGEAVDVSPTASSAAPSEVSPAVWSEVPSFDSSAEASPASGSAGDDAAVDALDEPSDRPSDRPSGSESPLHAVSTTAAAAIEAMVCRRCPNDAATLRRYRFGTGGDGAGPRPDGAVPPQVGYGSGRNNHVPHAPAEKSVT